MGRNSKKDIGPTSLAIIMESDNEGLGKVIHKQKEYTIATLYSGKNNRKKEDLIKERTNAKYPFQGYALVALDASKKIVNVFRDEIPMLQILLFILMTYDAL